MSTRVQQPSPSAGKAGVAFRAVRAAAFGAVCVLLTAAGHQFASGVPLPVRTLLCAWLLTSLAALAFTGRERSLPAITGALAGAQLLGHLVFSAVERLLAGGAPAAGREEGVQAWADRLLCGPRDSAGHVLLAPGTSLEDVVRRAGLDPAAHPHPGGVDGGAAGGLGGAGDLLAAATAHLSWTMLLGHLAAALVAGWWLRRGEVAAWRLATLTARHAVRGGVVLLATIGALLTLAGRWRPGGPPVAVPPLHHRERHRLPRSPVLRCCVVRRGPPVAARRSLPVAVAPAR
ncbi:hypothetical protein [Allostreptomyces psammosilenae]|uniref:Integral membrane protein n=1 Tax=Allostreptomyces psammosilenae TaxID=1892865 RepID=A0A852ZT29_9ACTN|nr:hypothetical protein [Allostreptomyces psammosilenae]NYI05489.1 hypothetical protein [Allostreptomyces psammosilenae]